MVTVTQLSLSPSRTHNHVLHHQKACLYHRHRHGRLRKVHFCPKVKRAFACTITARSSLCPQPRPCRGEPSLRSKYRHPRYHRLPRGHEAVRSRSSFLPYDRSPQVVHPRYNLGPNGGILTALNLFTTKFDQVLDLVEKRAETVECASVSCSYCRDPLSCTTLYLSSYVIVDTPGQIEIFTWSASGAIITDAVASALPTVVAYIVDTPRTVAPATFMSNMLYACRYVTL